MFKAFWDEIKKGICANRFNFVRAIGVLFIPCIYAFVYIFAFFNPFSYTQNIDIRVLTPKNDALGVQLVKNLEDNTEPINFGEVKFDLKYNKFAKDPDQIYIDTNQYNNLGKWDDRINELITKPYATLVINPFNGNVTDKNAAPNQNLTQVFGDMYIKAHEDIDNAITKKIALDDFMNEFQSFNTNPLIFYANYENNFIIPTGMDISSSLTQSMQMTLNILFKTLNDDNNSSNFVSTYIETQATAQGKDGAKFALDYHNFVTSVQNSALLAQSGGLFDQVDHHSQMDKQAKYGFALAPFFISIGLWVGAMGVSLAIHGKVYTPRVSKIKVYFGKLLLMGFAVLAQTGLLFIALGSIGFRDLGWTNFATYWMTAFIIGLSFCAIVQAIRFMIPHRVSGVLVVLAVLTIMMACSGGIFPIVMESSFFQVLHPFMPFSYSVNAFRQASFETDWVAWAENISICLAFGAGFAIVGSLVYNHRKKNVEQNWNWFGK